jgi:hypothetical protein
MYTVLAYIDISAMRRKAYDLKLKVIWMFAGAANCTYILVY